MDEVLRAVRERRSIRDFTLEEIPEEVVRKLIDALIWAPSAGNLQSRKFYFIKDKDVKKQLAAAALGQLFIAEAPLVVVGCADSRISGRYGERGVELYTIQDVSCSLMSLMLVAHENRLGTVWVGSFRESEARSALQLPGTLRPVALVPVGYPSRVPAAPKRVSVDEAAEFR
jgi:nitroreductase